MPTTNCCAPCLRVVKQQTPQALHRLSYLTTFRSFPHTHRSLASKAVSVPVPSHTSPIIQQVSPVVSSNTTPTSEGTKTHLAASPSKKIGNELRKRAPGVTETYVAYGITEGLVRECARHADYTIPQAGQKNAEIPKTQAGEDLGVGKGWWYEDLGLTPTFNNWAQITFLHMYILTTRLRCFPPHIAPTWHQHLIDHFSYIAEERMVTLHNIQARAVRNKYLKDLFLQWRGLTAAYDEGLISGDAVLATAIWRNVCKRDEDIDIRKLGMIVAYTRSAISALDALDDAAIAEGDVIFGDPSSEAELVAVRSKMLDVNIEEGLETGS